jgi:hypothetical protein
VTVRVERGRVVAVDIEDTGLALDPEGLTVPELFDLVQDHIDADSLAVEYDPDNVHELYFDPNEDTTDDQLTVVVRTFEVRGRPE